MAEIQKSLDEIYGKTISNYYTGNDVDIFFNNIYVDECTSFGFRTVVNNAPVYAYNSELFNTIAPGNIKVEGRFTVNFVANGYIERIIQKGDSALQNGDFSPLGRLSPIGESKTLSSEGILNANNPGFLNTVIFDPLSTKLSESEKQSARTILRDYIWGFLKVSDTAYIKSIRDVLVGKYFEILMLIGNPNSSEYDVKNLVNVQVIDVSMEVVPNMPLQMVYTFIAQDMDKPTSRPNPFEYFTNNVPTARSLELSPSSFLDKIIDATTQYTRINIINNHVKNRSLFNEETTGDYGSTLFKPIVGGEVNIGKDSTDKNQLTELITIKRALKGESSLDLRKADGTKISNANTFIKSLTAPLSFKLFEYNPSIIGDPSSIVTQFDEVSYGGFTIPEPTRIDVITNVLESNSSVDLDKQDKALTAIKENALKNSGPGKDGIFNTDDIEGSTKEDIETLSRIKYIPDAVAGLIYYDHNEHSFQDGIEKSSIAVSKDIIPFNQLLDIEPKSGKIQLQLIDIDNRDIGINLNKELQYLFNRSIFKPLSYIIFDTQFEKYSLDNIISLNDNKENDQKISIHIENADTILGSFAIIQINNACNIDDLERGIKDGNYYRITDFKITDGTNNFSITNLNNIKFIVANSSLHICIISPQDITFSGNPITSDVIDFTDLANIKNSQTTQVSLTCTIQFNKIFNLKNIFKDMFVTGELDKVIKYEFDSQLVDIKTNFTPVNFCGAEFRLNDFYVGKTPTVDQIGAYATLILTSASAKYIPCKINDELVFIVPLYGKIDKRKIYVNLCDSTTPSSYNFIGSVYYVFENLSLLFLHKAKYNYSSPVALNTLSYNNINSPSRFTYGTLEEPKKYARFLVHMLENNKYKTLPLNRVLIQTIPFHTSIYTNKDNNNSLATDFIPLVTDDFMKLDTIDVIFIPINSRDSIIDNNLKMTDNYFPESIRFKGTITFSDDEEFIRDMGLIWESENETMILAIRIDSASKSSSDRKKLIQYLTRLRAPEYLSSDDPTSAIFYENKLYIKKVALTDIQIAGFVKTNAFKNIDTNNYTEKGFLKASFNISPYFELSENKVNYIATGKSQSSIRFMSFDPILNQIINLDIIGTAYNQVCETYNRKIYEYLIGDLFTDSAETQLHKILFDGSDSASIAATFKNTRIKMDEIGILYNLIYGDPQTTKSIKFAGYVKNEQTIYYGSSKTEFTLINNENDPYYQKYYTYTIDCINNTTKKNYLVFGHNAEDALNIKNITLTPINYIFELRDIETPTNVLLNKKDINSMLLIHKFDDRDYQQYLSQLYSYQPPREYRYFTYEAFSNIILNVLNNDFPLEKERLKSSDNELGLMINQIMFDTITTDFTSRNVKGGDEWFSYINPEKKTTNLLVKSKKPVLFEDIFDLASKYSAVQFTTVSPTPMTKLLDIDIPKYLTFKCSNNGSGLDGTIYYKGDGVITEKSIFEKFRDLLLLGSKYDAYKFKIDLLIKDGITVPNILLSNIKAAFVNIGQARQDAIIARITNYYDNIATIYDTNEIRIRVTISL